MGTRGSVHLSAFLIGFGSLIAQVLVMREMVVTFYGNEISIGVMLATWLLWTGLGSLGLGRLVGRLKRPGLWLGAALLVGAVLLVATVVGAQYLKVILRAKGQASLGQIRPFGMMLVSCLALLGPFCLVNGFLFPLACRAARETGAAGSVGSVYLLEAVGAAVGGGCYSFALVQWVNPLDMAAALAAIWFLAASCLGTEEWYPVSSWVFVVLGAVGMGSACGIATGAGANRALSIEAAYWRPLLLMATTDSLYGRVSVTGQSWSSKQRSLYENGTLAFSYPDPPAAESVAHLPMLEHPNPRRVLLLGGGPGVVEEILKHPPVEKLTYVELDPVAVEMVRREFPPAAAQALADRRVAVTLADGRAFLKRTPQRFDVIIAATGPPTTAQANRFYTLEFFREAARVLEPGGVFAFYASGGHDYIPDESRRLLASLYRTVAAAFPAVAVFPGAPCTFLASNAEGVVGYRLGLLDRRMQERGLRTSSVDVTVWEADLMGGRLEELQRVLTAEPPPALNRDLAPRCYYFEAQRWSAQQRSRRERAAPSWLDLGRLLGDIESRPALAPVALLGVVLVLSLAVPLARGRWRDGVLSFAVTSTGFGLMAMEFVVLLGFQVVCGYVYHYLGVLMAALMLGLALGAWAASGWLKRGAATWRRMQAVQAVICIYPMVLYGVMALESRMSFGAVSAAAGVLFGLLALIAGVVCGLQFPLATALHTRGASAAGTLYGLDLFGSCLGALAVSAVLATIFGLGGVCLMLSALGALGLVGVLAAGRGAQNRVDFPSGEG